MKTLFRILALLTFVNIILYPFVLRDEKITAKQLSKSKKEPRIVSNNLELWHHDVSNPPPAGTIKVFLIGSSVAQDIALPVEKSTAYHLEKELQRRIGQPVKVYNLAKSGAAFLDDYFILQQSLRYQKPDLIIWAFYPGYDFNQKTSLTVSRSCYRSEPLFLLQNFSYLDPIFYFEQTKWEKEMNAQPFRAYVIKRNLLLEKVNFTISSFMHQLPLIRFFSYRELNNSYLGGHKAESDFYAALKKKLPDIATKNEPKAETFYTCAPNSLSDLAVKFISECNRKKIPLVIYNYPASYSTFFSNQYQKNLHYMERYFHTNNILYIKFQPWSREFFYDGTHFNEKGTARLAPLLAEKIAPFIEQKLAHNKTGGKQ